MRELPSTVRDRIRAGGRNLGILAVRLGAMGDILRTVPAVRLLRSGLPESAITFVVDDRWENILRGHPDIDSVVTFPRRRFTELLGSPSDYGTLISALASWRGRLRDLQPSVTLDFHGNLRSGIVSAFSGASVRIGYGGHQQKEGNRLFTTHRVKAGGRRVSRIDRNLALVGALGVPTEPVPGGGLPELEEDGRQALKIAATLFGDDKPYAVISPGASVSQAYKRPPATLLALAARYLEKEGIGSLVVYGPGEEPDAEAVVREAGGAARISPPTTLPQLAAALRRAVLFIGGDTGPLHLACAVGCPVLGLYGPTDPVVNSPWGVPYEIVHPTGRVYTGIKKVDRSAGRFEGMEPQDVEHAVSRLLARCIAPRKGDGGSDK